MSHFNPQRLCRLLQGGVTLSAPSAPQRCWGVTFTRSFLCSFSSYVPGNGRGLGLSGEKDQVLPSRSSVLREDRQRDPEDVTG